MIGVANQGKSFRALIAYVLKKKDGIEQDPVAWTASRNLPTDDPKRAVSFMNATALQTPRAREPAYHIVLSFAPEDPVDRAMMERVGDHVLARLDLAEHQAVFVAHRDRPHAHLHMWSTAFIPRPVEHGIPGTTGSGSGTQIVTWACNQIHSQSPK